MPSPVQVVGSRPPTRVEGGVNRGQTTGTLGTNSKKKTGKKGTGGEGKKKISAEGRILNPPFDPRMRKIGSPLNRSTEMKRGWIQDEAGENRVNFLFNPPQIDLTHGVVENMLTPRQVAEQMPDLLNLDVAVAAPTVGSDLSLTLLYDRTYELYSPPKSLSYEPVKTFGVAADVFAWYVYLGMLEEMPLTWAESLPTSPPVYVPSYLVVGATSVFYGYPTGIQVTYAHFTQTMIPARCSIDIGFTILPKPAGANVPGLAQEASEAVTGWAQEWIGGNDGGESKPGQWVEDLPGRSGLPENFQ